MHRKKSFSDSFTSNNEDFGSSGAELVRSHCTGCVKSNLEVLKFIKTISVCLII